LEHIFPPVYFKKEKIKYCKKVSLEDSSRVKLEELEKRLGEMMENENAKKKGICQIREKIHYFLFDEIIR